MIKYDKLMRSIGCYKVVTISLVSVDFLFCLLLHVFLIQGTLQIESTESLFNSYIVRFIQEPYVILTVKYTEFMAPFFNKL